MNAPSTTSRRRVSADEALALWSEYKRTGDVQVRNRLVMTFAPLVKYIVFKKVRELPARCEVEDFISCGLEALIASIDRYDPDKGATLEQFAWTRIHGAVLDELRRQDWAPRSLRRWERDIARARTQFLSNNGRRPTNEELAASLAITVDELRTKQDEISVSDVTSLNTLVVSEDETTVERIDTIAETNERMDPEHARPSLNPPGGAEEETTVERTHPTPETNERMPPDPPPPTRQPKNKSPAASEQLPRREREVAVMLYVNNMTLREIGDVLGVSE